MDNYCICPEGTLTITKFFTLSATTATKTTAGATKTTSQKQHSSKNTERIWLIIHRSRQRRTRTERRGTRRRRGE